MGGLVQKKAQLTAQIAADREELARIDAELSSYRKKLEDVQSELKEKTEKRDKLKEDHESSAGRIKGTVKGAADLLQQARIMSRKISRQSASDRLTESRGYTSTVPTTTLVKGGTLGAGTGRRPESVTPVQSAAK